ncbi:hypothetical protein Hanom_Chr06g00559421 [Helianthus anomalus]
MFNCSRLLDEEWLTRLITLSYKSAFNFLHSFVVQLSLNQETTRLAYLTLFIHAHLTLFIHANHRDTGRCGQGRLLDRRQPLGSPRCAETQPPRTRRHGSGIIGKNSSLIQDEPAPPVFALHLDATENNGKSGSRT